MRRKHQCSNHSGGKLAPIVIGLVIVAVGFWMLPTLVKIAAVAITFALVTLWGVARAQHMSVSEVAVLCVAQTATTVFKALAVVLVELPLLIGHRATHRLDPALRIRLVAWRTGYAAYDHATATVHRLRTLRSAQVPGTLEDTVDVLAAAADGPLTETA